MPTWFLLSLISVTALAFAELTQQHLLNSENKFSPRSSAFFTFLSQTLIVIPLILFSSAKKEFFSLFTYSLFLPIVLVTFLVSLAILFYFQSFKVKNISISTIFISCSAVVSTFLGILFLNESSSPIKFLGITLVLGAIAFLNYKISTLEKNHLYGIGAGIFFGAAYTIDKVILTQSIPPLVYIFWAFPLVALFSFLQNPQDIINTIKTKHLTDYKPIFLSSLGYLIYNFCTFSSYPLGGEVGRVDAINNSQVFLIIMFEFLILKHRTDVWKKIIAASIAYLGVLILGLY